MDTVYTPSHIANYFIWKSQQEKRDDLTPMKLIKLVYISYAWRLAITDKRLFDEDTEAWDYGPVIPSLYHEFKRFGINNISDYAADFDKDTGRVYLPVVHNDLDTLKMLNIIWSKYKDKSGYDLSNITHQEDSPWRKAFIKGKNTPLDDADVKKRAGDAIIKLLGGSEGEKKA